MGIYVGQGAAGNTETAQRLEVSALNYSGRHHNFDLSAIETLKLDGNDGLLEQAARSLSIEAEVMGMPDIVDARLSEPSGKFSRAGFKSMFGNTVNYLIPKRTGEEDSPRTFYQGLCDTFRESVAIHGVSEMEIDAKLAQFNAFAREVVPRFLLISARSNEDRQLANERVAVFQTLSMFVDQLVRDGKIRFFSPLCPPYNYKVELAGNAQITAGTPVSHLDGQILPSVGEGFNHAAHMLQFAFAPVLLAGCEVEWTSVHYSGENGVEGLTELGLDSRQYYQNAPSELTERMGAAFADLHERAARINMESGLQFTADVTSIESLQSYIDQARTRLQEGYSKSNPILRRIMVYFIEQEMAYQKKQGTIDHNKVFTAALDEAATYFGFLEVARQNRCPIVGMETTSNYMIGMARHFAGTFNDEIWEVIYSAHQAEPVVYPVTMLSPFSPVSATGLNIREPWNAPTIVRINQK